MARHVHIGNPGGWCKACDLHYDHPDHIKQPVIHPLNGHQKCDNYIDDLVDTIHQLQEDIDLLRYQNTLLYQENKSYKMWQNRTITRIKEMQS